MPIFIWALWRPGATSADAFMASATSASRVDDAMTAVCLLVRRRPRLSACQPWRLPLFAGLTSVHTRLRRLGLSAAIDCFARRSYAAQPLTLSNHAQALAVLQRQGRQSTSSCSDCSSTTCSRRDASGGLGKPRNFRLASVLRPLAAILARHRPNPSSAISVARCTRAHVLHPCLK